MLKNLLKNLIAATVIVFTVGVGSAWADEIEFIKNPNKLPLCPALENSKVAIEKYGSKAWHWDKCWGIYDFGIGGLTYEGEFLNGKEDGFGSIFWVGRKESGKYVGEWKEGATNGYGMEIGSYGEKYIGMFKNGNREGMGIATLVDGRVQEGIWKEGKLIREIKIDENIITEYKLKFKGKNKIENNNQFYPYSYNANPNKLKLCKEIDISKQNDFERTKKWNNCWGKYTYISNQYRKGDVVESEWVKGLSHGQGVYFFASGSKYIGEFKNDSINGKGVFILFNGNINEGIYENDEFIKEIKISLPILSNKVLEKNKNFESERQQLAEERRKFEEEKRSREQARNNQRINLQVTNTQANAEGDFVINIQTGTDTASLKINGEESGGRVDGNYAIKKVARAGQETKFTIVARDINGNTDSKTITVTRQVTASNTIKYAELNPALVKTQPSKDAVAIIIGIADYKNLPRADYANDDARVFYDYAIRGLGVRAENIKLLVDADAGHEEIYKAFKTWLPARVKATTDVYVYYSGHGITTNDGQSLYLLPQRTDRDLIEETAIAQSKINAAIQAAKPKSVTIFLDSCYSGAGRTGATLLASARPIAIKSTAQAFPAEFTVISASTAEQISSSSNELKHGIFSYYLMRGMEGEADSNKDGKITAGEMHSYLIDNVTRQASLANRVQQPQLSGDANRVLVGK